MVNKVSSGNFSDISCLNGKLLQNQKTLAPRYSSKVFGHDIENLIKEFGSPLFIISEEKIRKNVRNIQRSFKNLYPNIVYSWSYKTNYLNAICKIMHQEGAWAEVVSEFEYEKATKLNTPGEQIIYNGPYKSDNSIKKAISNGSLINIDNFDELYKIMQISESLNIEANICIRVNCETEISENWVKFGFNIESGEAILAAKSLIENSSVNLVGIHIHVGTFITNAEVYEIALHKICQLILQIKSEFDYDITTIDIGGGFASKNQLKSSYLPADVLIPDFEEYAAAICDTITNFYSKNLPSLKLPRIILEAGRGVIDDTASLLSSVVARKSLPNGNKGYILDAGMNLLFTSIWYNHPVKLIKKPEENLYQSTLFGPLCMNIDILRQNIMLPELKLQDRLAFELTGAYNMTQWMQFIEMRPNVVMALKSGDIEIIRHKESVETLNNQERIPANLD